MSNRLQTHCFNHFLDQRQFHKDLIFFLLLHVALFWRSRRHSAWRLLFTKPSVQMFLIYIYISWRFLRRSIDRAMEFSRLSAGLARFRTDVAPAVDHAEIESRLKKIAQVTAMWALVQHEALKYNESHRKSSKEPVKRGCATFLADTNFLYWTQCFLKSSEIFLMSYGRARSQAYVAATICRVVLPGPSATKEAK